MHSEMSALFISIQFDSVQNIRKQRRLLASVGRDSSQFNVKCFMYSVWFWEIFFLLFLGRGGGRKGAYVSLLDCLMESLCKAKSANLSPFLFWSRFLFLLVAVL